MTEKKTKKTRGRKPKKKMYFGIDVQNKIIEYQKEEDLQKRNKLYEDHIQPAFSELVFSLVSVYGFKSSNEDIEHLKQDCISALFEVLHKWDYNKGTKAFSYFNVVAKNWLTIHSRRLLKNAKRSVYIDDKDSLSKTEKDEIYNQEYEDPTSIIEISKKRFEVIMQIIDHIEGEIKEDRDKRCCIAIRKVYNSIEELEFFNKRAVFVYLREISGLNSSELSSSLSNIRKIYKKNVGENKRFSLKEKDLI
tara:strand:+ start:92 stop:838 length:747 start_codon:yes stop_codon:yes gene_type:complete